MLVYFTIVSFFWITLSRNSFITSRNSRTIVLLVVSSIVKNAMVNRAVNRPLVNCERVQFWIRLAR